MRQQFRIRALMVLVLAAGLGLAALAKPTEIGIRLAFSFALLATLSASIGAIVGLGATRSRCVGFATMAGGTLLLALGPWCASNVAPHLASTALIDWAYQRLGLGPGLDLLPPPGQTVWKSETRLVDGTPTTKARILTQVFPPGMPGGSVTGVLTAITPGPSQDDYRRLGHSLLAMVLGLVGAMIAARFDRTPDRRGRAAESPPEGPGRLEPPGGDREAQVAGAIPSRSSTV